MKIITDHRRTLPGQFLRVAQWLGVVFVLCAYRPEASAQLAITEVMSQASTNESGLTRSDFWELTNFGTNAVNMDDYRWYDSGSFEFSISFPEMTIINPRETIIFARSSPAIPDTNAFREWWGSNLPSDLRVHVLPTSFGFDGQAGDAVRIWHKSGVLVDEVHFDAAQTGVTFTYDTNSGAFSEMSREGVAGAFRAVMGGDIGSPGYGTNKGPVALRIVQQPVSQTVEPGAEVILRVHATGRPAPGYQWYFNDVAVQVSAADSSVPELVCYADCGPSWRRPFGPNDLALTNIQPWQSGDYRVEVFNGLERLTSAVARVTVNTNPSPIHVECPLEESCVPCAGNDSPVNLVASPGQTAIFTVRNRGYPLPAFQWSHSGNGVIFSNIPGETNRDLTIANIGDSVAGFYRVRMENSLGSTAAFARLTIKPSPQLEITEVMSWACPPIDLDWWELTNTGREPVNLCGYRWDDETGGTIGGGPTITNNVTVQPGESVILLESQTAESFIQWWGASNLPPQLQFVTYHANGLGETGDSIHLWEPTETITSEHLANVTFGDAIRGFTRWFDTEGCKPLGTEVTSVEGECGAFRANLGCEIGSPGWTRWTPPTLTSVRREASGVVLSWSAQPGSTNRVQFARQLATPLSATIWEDLRDYQFTTASCLATDSTVGTESQRFYRVMRVAVANCPCPGPEE